MRRPALVRLVYAGVPIQGGSARSDNSRLQLSCRPGGGAAGISCVVLEEPTTPPRPAPLECARDDDSNRENTIREGRGCMKAIRVHEFGEPAVMRLEAVPEPTAGKGQVVVGVRAVGVNPVDTYIRAGTYHLKPDLPYTPGGEAAGVVEAVGEGVTSVAVGDRVYTSRTLSGASAEKSVVRRRDGSPSARQRLLRAGGGGQCRLLHRLPGAVSARPGSARGVGARQRRLGCGGLRRRAACPSPGLDRHRNRRHGGGATVGCRAGRRPRAGPHPTRLSRPGARADGGTGGRCDRGDVGQREPGQ